MENSGSMRVYKRKWTEGLGSRILISWFTGAVAGMIVFMILFRFRLDIAEKIAVWLASIFGADRISAETIGIAVILVIIVITLFITYLLRLSSKIRFELEQDGTLRYYINGKLRNTFDVTACGMRLRTKYGYWRSDNWEKMQRGEEPTPAGRINFELEIIESGGRSVKIDCSPLGKEQVTEMWKQFEDIRGERH